MQRHVVVLPLNDGFKLEIEQLLGWLKSGSTESLSARAGQLLTDITCQTIDHVFEEMMQRFLRVEGLPEDKKAKIHESIANIEEVKSIIHKYMGWAISKFSNERILPVISYFYHTIESRDGQSQLVVSLSETTAQRAIHSLQDLKLKRVNDMTPAIECLIEVTDIVIDKLIRHPMHLLKFNIVVEKTLNGVIKMTTSMAYKNLLKLGRSLDPVLYDTAADHLQQFLQVR